MENLKRIATGTAGVSRSIVGEWVYKGVVVDGDSRGMLCDSLPCKKGEGIYGTIFQKGEAFGFPFQEIYESGFTEVGHIYPATSEEEANKVEEALTEFEDNIKILRKQIEEYFQKAYFQEVLEAISYISS